jgi:lipid A 4'-phosphatase
MDRQVSIPTQSIAFFPTTCNDRNLSMTDPQQPTTAAFDTPRLYLWLIGVFVLAAVVPTLWTPLDLQAAALFAGSQAPVHAVNWWWVEWINAQIPTVFRYFLLIAFMGWVASLFIARWKPWRMALAFVVVAGILGPGAIVNWGFKDNWQRARPYQVQAFGGTQTFTRAAVMTDQCDANCSFVSGHVACGIFLASIGLVHRRRMGRWAAVGVAAGLVIGFARMADVAHWLSDVLWAFPITLCTSWLVWKVMLLYRKPSFTVG